MKKNIHLIKTDRESRLHNTFGILRLEKEYDLSPCNLNIYITSDEEIATNDYITDGYKIWKWKDISSLLGRKKIILSTNQDLIKDGVQAISDEFLEWFVNNSSCEFAMTLPDVRRLSDVFQTTSKYLYRIIIPQEEIKQDWYCPKCKSYVSSESVTFEETHQLCNTSVIIKEPKQETLEEAAENFMSKNTKEFDFRRDSKFWNFGMKLIKFGAKWQQEQDKNKYSELSLFLEKEADKDRLKSLTSNQIRTLIQQYKKK